MPSLETIKRIQETSSVLNNFELDELQKYYALALVLGYSKDFKSFKTEYLQKVKDIIK